MKPTEISTEQGFDALIAIAPEIEPILLDPTLTGLFTEKVDKGKAIEAGIKRITRIIPLLMKDYRQNMFRIIGALNGKMEQEVASQRMTETIKQIVDIFRDKELLDFFRSLKLTAQDK